MPRHDEGYFSARDNTRLFWRFDAPEGEAKAHVVVVHGYGDHCGRYSPFIDALVQAGFAVHAFDYRGHGRADGRRAFVSIWSHYVDDLDVFLERVKRDAGDKKIFLFGHSHGGLMAVHRVRRDSGLFAGMILSAPYLELAITPPFAKLLLSRTLGKLLPFLPVPSEIEIEDLTRDTKIQEETRRDSLYLRNVTPGWFNESLKAQAAAMTFGPEIKLPSYIFVGDADGVAAPKTARRFFETLGAPDKKFREYPGMRHEPLNELGRDELYKDIIGWISARL